MAKVAILTLTTAVETSDTRVFKEARTLQGAGYKVRVIGKRGDHSVPFETIDGLEVWRVDTAWKHEPVSNLKTKLRHYFLTLLRLICGYYSGYVAYYWEAYKLIRKNRVDIYHAHDLDILPVAVLCKLRFGGKIVYDSHEVWLFRNRLPKRSKWNTLVMWLVEFLLVRFADTILTTSEGHSKLMRKLYLVKPIEVYNAEELAKAIIKLLQDSELRRQMGDNGRKYVVENHSWESVAKRVAEVCEQAIEDRKRQQNEEKT